jgi:hypothetical protein
MNRIIKHILVVFVTICLIPGLALAEIKLGDHIKSLKLKGDLRVRFERHDQDKDAGKNTDTNNPKDRLRTRFRLGAFWNAPDEKWEIGAGLATGGGGSTSTNDTWSEDDDKTVNNKDFFKTGDIRLDYAYAKHSLDVPGMKKVNIIVGQQKNPFKTSWLLWDSDVRPAGFTGHVDTGIVFATIGGYDVLQNGNDVDMMYALQGGSKIKNGNIAFTGALTGYFFSTDFDKNHIFGSSYEVNKDYEYQIIDLYGKIDIKLDKKIKISPYLQVFQNIGADGEKGQGVLGGDLEPDSENTGWTIGVDTKFMDASFKLSYASVGADSCVPGLKNADFGSKIHKGVNVSGAVVAAGYKLTKHFSTELTAYLYKALEEVTKDDPDNDKNMQMYHFDLKYKF